MSLSLRRQKFVEVWGPAMNFTTAFTLPWHIRQAISRKKLFENSIWQSMGCRYPEITRPVSGSIEMAITSWCRVTRLVVFLKMKWMLTSVTTI